MMENNPWTPLGQLLLDYYGGQHDVKAEVIWEDGIHEPLSAAVFFRNPFPDKEVAALELCRGRVLDVGAGAGTHALELQERGLDVCALDVCPQAVEVMRRRGVRRARQGDVFDETSGGYDTLLMLMNGIGLVGTLAGLERFFDQAEKLLAEGGELVVDSSDLRITDDVRELERLVVRVREGRYRGETRQQIRYNGVSGAPLHWLYLDPATLRVHARRRGWFCQIVFHGDDGSFVARLLPPREPSPPAPLPEGEGSQSG